MSLKGHCQCGAVRYETNGMPHSQTNCHCSICRRSSGAPFVAWFTVPTSDFRFLVGTPARFASSQHGTRSFCASCGTPLTFQSSALPDEIDVTICSLDDPNDVTPRDHTHTRSKLAGVSLCDGLPAYEGARPS